MRGSFKSRTYRRVHVRTPGGRTVLHMKRRAPEKPHCADCGLVLQGVARALPFEVGKLSKTERRPERPYGGVLCSACTRAKFSHGSENVNSKFEVGTLCIKTAGRDGGRKCIILNIEGSKAFVDGETRRRIVNLSHLSPVGKTEIRKDASRADVVKAFGRLGLELVDKKPKAKTEKPLKIGRSEANEDKVKAGEKEKGIKKIIKKTIKKV